MPKSTAFVRYLWMVIVGPTLLFLATQSASAAAPTATYTISGTVRDHNRAPVVGVLVSTDLFDPEIEFVHTDAQGKYSLSVATPGDYHISVSYYNNQLDPPAQTVSVPPSKSDVDFTFAESYSIRGVVTGADGLPAAGATVSTNDLTDPLGGSAQTDANGVYTLTLGPGIYHVSAELEGFISPPAQRIIVPPSRAGIDFALFTTYTIRGTVRLFDGQPASGFSIATAQDDPMAAFATTAPDGTYTLFVRAGAYHLFASFLGYETPPPKTVTVPPNKTGVDFSIPKLIQVSGAVRDDTGQPVVGAFVNEGSISSATTAADGSYTLGVTAGEHWINAFSDVNFFNSYDGGFDIALVPAPPAVTDLDFILRRRNRTITGRVVDHEGQPVNLADVFATNPLDGMGQVRSSDVNGFYTLTVPADVYWVHAEKHFSVFDHNPNALTPFYPSFSQEVDVAEDSAQAVNFTLQPVTGLITVHGHVKNHLGGPVNLAVVSATPTDPLSCGGTERVLTDATGAYTMTIRPGEYSVSAFLQNAPSPPNQAISIPPNGGDVTVDFTYAPLYVISGQVTRPQNKPVQYVLIRAAAPGLAVIYNSATTAADGYYNLYVAAGTYTVTAFMDQFTPSPAQVVTVPAPQGAPPTDINFALTPIPPPALIIRGKVVDETGQPAPNSAVSRVGSLFGGKTVYYDGTYAMSVYPGTYTLFAGDGGYIASATQQVTVPPNAIGLDFTVRRADHFLFGQVTDDGGNALCNATVSITSTGANIAGSSLTDASGRFAFRLPAGEYTLAAARQGYATTPPQHVTLPPTATQVAFVMRAGTEQESVYLPAMMDTQ